VNNGFAVILKHSHFAEEGIANISMSITACAIHTTPKVMLGILKIVKIVPKVFVPLNTKNTYQIAIQNVRSHVMNSRQPFIAP
jgi:hypothetical protein